MSRIDELITDLCPNGVEFRPLGEYLDYEQPTKYLVASTEYDNSFNTPVLTAGQTFILGYTDETQGIYLASSDEPVIIFDDFTTAFKWVDFPFKAKSSAMKMLRPRQNAAIDFRYVYYAMLCIGYSPQDHARHWIAKYSQFKIPVPPIEVQREIVRILDTFGRLEAELEAELEARRKQYTFYRDQLLAFTSGEIRWAKMSEVGEFIRGKTLLKTDLIDEGMPAIHYGQVHTHYGTWATTTKSFVSPALAKSLRFAKPGDLVIATTSEDDDGVGKAVAWIGDEPAAVSSDAYIYRHALNPKYMSYLFQTEAFKKQRSMSITGTKVRRVSGEALGKILIPVPSVDEQERIVSILDRFNILVNDLSSGLPAELNARRQQYEHYRDRLLTFQEAT